VLLVRLGVEASAVLHRNLLDSIFRAPQSFFDTTPVGRILSRFSKDFYSIDVELSDQLDMFLFMVLTLLVSLATIVFVTPWFGIAVVPLGYMYFNFINYYRSVSRETKRLESVSRSPVYGQFSETLGGLTTIRAYGQATRFQYSFDTKIDVNIRAWYCNKFAERWLAVRLEFIGGCITGLAGVFATSVTLSSGATAAGSTDNFASLAGLSLTFAISMTAQLNWCVRTFAQLEAAMNSVERVLYYTEQIPQEAPRTSSELVAHAASTNPSISYPSAFAVDACGGKAADMPPSWPDKGYGSSSLVCGMTKSGPR
jgi:ATP-binding cassette subfamily C (CFTR/MRP) protein 1